MNHDMMTQIFVLLKIIINSNSQNVTKIKNIASTFIKSTENSVGP